MVYEIKHDKKPPTFQQRGNFINVLKQIPFDKMKTGDHVFVPYSDFPKGYTVSEIRSRIRTRLCLMELSHLFNIHNGTNGFEFWRK